MDKLKHKIERIYILKKLTHLSWLLTILLLFEL
jgi:hypothetical protein